ncbi:hypothetical protein ES319_D05G049800v1 [Gossypium barbadense]|uniref:Uncharacterized protein n=3 Tax=Gossypium TaxID=3633 RepID=A0A5J5R9M8_GOSBA|nr:hypothetical protein ES319_D05G049800v1 [Gossypium barbadense]TYG67128.1 hypothetical protein ES288_D05G053400v1 [Gossypium darwinii]TYH69424.1 hypothetical protein ES332_D05G054600v1 [Gossypium tomentosum]
MFPNLELIFLASLYGSYIACVLLLASCLILITLLLTFSLSTFSVVFIDIFTIFSLFSQLIGSIKADVDLGFVLLLCMFLQYGIAGVSALKPSFHRLVFLLRLKLQDTMNRIHAWLAVAPPHQKISAVISSQLFTKN